MIFLLACLAVQAALLLFRLDLLDLWTDELFTMQTVVLPAPEILAAIARDIHPPLYYLLQHWWLHVPLPVAAIVKLRMLSAGFALLGTVALDRLWAVRLEERWRRWLLALWVASPCLVLYGRMARSYSLQVLVAMVAAYLLWRYLENGTRRDLLLLAGGLALAWYTHYVPGAALSAAAAVLLVRRGRYRALAALAGLVALGYLPWLWVMADSVGKWARSGQTYALTGNPWTEMALKAAFAAVSLGLGESLPWWGWAAGIVLLGAAVWLGVKGGGKEPDLAWFAGAMAVVGFLGVARWVSYAFLPARLLFVLPFLLLLFVRGCGVRPRIGAPVAGGLLALSAVGLWGYYHKQDFLNKGYAMPFVEMTDRIRETPAAGSLVLCDSLNTDYPVIEHYLGAERRVILIGDRAAEARVDAALADPSIRTVWLVRNLHDISPGHSNSRISTRLGAAWRTERFGYLPLTAFERGLARLSGGGEAPLYFYEAARFRR